MPTYSYACTACEHQVDTVRKFTNSSLTDCPQCSGRLRKLFSSVGIVFKGSGFYRTDSRAGNEPRSNGKPESGSKPGSESGSTPSGSTSEAKSGSGSVSSSSSPNSTTAVAS